MNPTPDNQNPPAPFRILSTKWVATNPLPEDGIALAIEYPKNGWLSSTWQGCVVPKCNLAAFRYATAQPLPEEAFAEPAWAEEKYESLHADFQTAKVEIATLRTALAGMTAQRDEAIANEQERWQNRIDHVFGIHIPDAKIDGGGCDSGDPLDFSESELHQAFQYLEAQRDAKDVEIEHILKGTRAAIDRGDKLAGENAKLSRFREGCAQWKKIADSATAELDEVRKERDAWRDSFRKINVKLINLLHAYGAGETEFRDGERINEMVTRIVSDRDTALAAKDASQAHCGELERALQRLRKAESYYNQKARTENQVAEECVELILAQEAADAILTPSQQPDKETISNDSSAKEKHGDFRNESSSIGFDSHLGIAGDASPAVTSLQPAKEHVGAGEWLPMETAPKRKVLLRLQTSPDAFRTVEALWVNGQWDFDGMLFFKPVGWKPAPPIAPEEA